MTFISHYSQRVRALGVAGTVRRAKARTMDAVVPWSQSLWWGYKARQQISDARLLALTTGSWNSVNDLLDHLGTRSAMSFLLPHESSGESAAIMWHNYREHATATIAAADAACRYKLSLFGHQFDFSQEIDWHKDPVTGWQWPLVHRSRISRYLGAQRPVDLIHFWELNRHQHFVYLGVAYWLTGDPKYAHSFSSQVLSWIESNPVQHGMNWYYGLEVSIRLLSWIAAFQFFRCAPEFRDVAGAAFLKSLWQQTDFLSSHLQTTRVKVPNNHLMAELTGLVLVGTVFPEFRAAKTWREMGLQLLVEQATAQTHPDGVNKEQAIGYHRFVAELLLLVAARSRYSELPRQPALEHILAQMLEYVLFSLTPDGTAPLWGDSDYGKVLGLAPHKNFWDFRPLLSAGAVLFERADWKYASGVFDAEAFCLLGQDGLRRWDELKACPPKQTSQGFPDAGLYIIRDNWTAETDLAFFRCGPLGLGGEGHCAHAHCDLLSVILWIRGRPLLIDPGTYIYHGPWRDYFRLTSAHNTVVVDGCEQASPNPNFNWTQVPRASCLEWTGQSIEGSLSGQNQVNFVRQLAHPFAGVWTLNDKFRAAHAEAHRLTWYLHFEPGLTLRCTGESHYLVLDDSDRSWVCIRPPSSVVVELKQGWVSYHYGSKVPNVVLQATWAGEICEKGLEFRWTIEHCEHDEEHR